MTSALNGGPMMSAGTSEGTHIDSAPATTSSEYTPVVSGFHPDPSICRLGEDYYLAFSSFEYLPGVPIFHSRDLITWKQIANALTETHLPPVPMRTWLDGSEMSSVLERGAANTGVFAPTLRVFGGRFWLAVTDVNQYDSGPLIVSASSPEGPWSAPIHVPGLRGIDPDLVWDEAGVCHVTVSSYDGSDGVSIVSAPVDLETGALLDQPRQLWNGTGGLAPEGPHLYYRNGWWHLILAEGGTERGHSIVSARSRSLEGTWEPHPDNPILTRRGTDHPIQSVGHADLVEGVDGSWSMAYLGTRPKGISPGFHVNGRETFMAHVRWIDDWPLIEVDGFNIPEPNHSFATNFENSPLEPRWISPGQSPGRLTSHTAQGLEVTADHSHSQNNLVATRVRDPLWSAWAVVDGSHGVGGLVVRVDPQHCAEVLVDHGALYTRICIGGVERRTPHPDQAATLAKLGIRVRSDDAPPISRGPDVVELGIWRENEWTVLDSVDGRYLSTEVVGGWTGRVVGLRAVAGRITVRSFGYETGQTGAPID